MNSITLNFNGQTKTFPATYHLYVELNNNLHSSYIDILKRNRGNSYTEK